MNLSAAHIWFIILALAAGTFLIRFSFLGLIGNRNLPDWVLRHLRYTPVAVIPGLVAPLVLWHDGVPGVLDPAQIAAAIATVTVGMWRKSLLSAILAGGLVYFAGLWVIG
ncbi:MAG: AzlD domain-containing protein [Pseudomonadota bacterium]